MAAITIETLTSPVTDDDPCGPDLDLTGDPEFMTYMARAEGLLPTSYFSGTDGKQFDRSSIDFPAEFESAKPFLERTRDIRLLVHLAKFSTLNRDLDGFVKFVSAIASLLENKWDEVHPRGEDGDYSIRMAVLETLDDTAPVIMPLQYMTLAENRRLGAITYRSFMFATDEASPREGEESHDAATLDKALLEADLSKLVDCRDRFETLLAALTTVKKVCEARIGSGGSANLEKLSGLVGKIFSLLNGVIAKRDPNAAAEIPADIADTAPTTASAPSAVPQGRITCGKDAAIALASIGRYFSRFEPSNPALLLVRQAEQLMGKSLLEVMQILMPAQIEQAKFTIGKDNAFELPIERLTPFASIEQEPESDSWGDSSESDQEPAEQGEVGGGSEAPDSIIQDSEMDEANGRDATETPSSQNSSPGGPSSEEGLTASSRQEAFALLEQVAAYYRVAEPSSPIALLAERARTFANRDFLAVMKDLLPPQAPN